VVETAPRVVFRGGDQTASYGIAVDVADFFDAFFWGVYVEVVVTPLPELLLV